MKTNVKPADIQEALARVDKARTNHTNASRRLTRARASVQTAEQDVAEAEEELKTASTALDQAVRKGISFAMKKGGTDISIAMAEIIARSIEQHTNEDDADDADDENAKRPSEDVIENSESLLNESKIETEGDVSKDREDISSNPMQQSLLPSDLLGSSN